MVETISHTISSGQPTAIPTTIPTTLTTTSTISIPASIGTSSPPGQSTAHLNSSSRPIGSNDEVTRGVFNIKVIVFFILLPIILLAVFLKHLLDYLFGLTIKEKDVSGKVALVTGAGSRLGREIAIELARKGCKVAVVDAHSKICYETVDLISKIPRSIAKAYKTDVSSPREVQMLAAKVEKELGPIEILVNNASLMQMTSTPQLKSDEMERIISVNLGSYINTTKEFLPKMVARKSGHIIAVCALAGIVPLPGAGIYTATKYGILGFMEALRAELRLSDSDFVRTTVANVYLMKTSEDLHLLNNAGVSSSYPGLPLPYVAEKIVRGTLRNERMLYVPKIFGVCVWLLRLLPTKWQDYVLLKFYKFDVQSAHLFYWK